MGELIPRMSNAMASVQPRDLMSRVPARVQRAVDAEIGEGLVRAARAQADAFVAHTKVEGVAMVAQASMQRMAQLSADEVRFSAASPMAEPRFRAIADAFAQVVTNEITRLGYGL